MSNVPVADKSKVMFHFILCAIITLVLIMVTGRSLATPSHIKEEITSQTLTQKATFAPRVIPKVSALYPQPMPFGEQKTYFTQVTDSLQVAVKIDLASNPASQVEGTSKVLLHLQAGDLWERNFVLAPEKPFQGSGDATILNQEFVIPLQQILAFMKQVEEETQVYPNDGYILSVNPVLKTKTSGNQETLTNDFTPTFPIKLTQREITPLGETTQEHSTALKKTNNMPGNFNIFGFKIPVLAARSILGLSTIFFIGLSLMLGRTLYRNRQPLTETQSINRRYRGRLVNAQNHILDPDLTVIRLATFKELLKLADERDKSIVCLKGDNNQTNTCRYCVPDGHILYCYVALDQVPDKKNIFQSTYRERVAAEEGSTP